MNELRTVRTTDRFGHCRKVELFSDGVQVGRAYRVQVPGTSTRIWQVDVRSVEMICREELPSEEERLAEVERMMAIELGRQSAFWGR